MLENPFSPNSYIASIKHTQYLIKNLIRSSPHEPRLRQQGLWDFPGNLSTQIF